MVLKESNLAGIGTGLVLGGINIILLVFIHPWTLNLGLTITGFIILVGIIGVFQVLLSQAYEVTVNKPAKKIIFNKTAVIGSKTNTYATDGLARIELRRKYISQTRLQSQIFIVFKNRQEVALDHMQQSNSFSRNGLSAGTRAENELVLGIKMANFLGVPFQNSDPSTSGTHF